MAMFKNVCLNKCNMEVSKKIQDFRDIPEFAHLHVQT